MLAIAIGVTGGLWWVGGVSQAAEPVSLDILLQAADESRSVELSQGQSRCGSCWAFRTVAPLEANILIHDGVAKDVSEQYLISGNHNGWSCSGGDFAHDYHLAAKVAGEQEAGAVCETALPYQAVNASLNPPHAHHEKIASWGATWARAISSLR